MMREVQVRGSLFAKDHAIHVALFLEVGPRVVDGVDGSPEEFPVRVLLANVLLVEVDLDELLNEHRVSGKQVLLCEARVIDKALVLRN